MSYGRKRTKAEIAEFRREMLQLYSQGFSKLDIQTVFKEKYDFPISTFNKHWPKVMEEEEKRIFKEKREIIVGFVNRCNNRVREADINYKKTNDHAWLNTAHRVDKDFFEKMQSIGLIVKEPEKLNIGLQERLLNAIKEAREEIESGNANIP